MHYTDTGCYLLLARHLQVAQIRGPLNATTAWLDDGNDFARLPSRGAVTINLKRLDRTRKSSDVLITNVSLDNAGDDLLRA